MTPTSTITLADFLLARIAEEEEVARLHLMVEQSTPPHELAAMEALAGAFTEMFPPLTTPARVLAECEAKRRIVAAYATELDARLGGGAGFDERDLEFATRCLAAAYAEHPDYRDEWRV